ncbi:hypothetical protein [Nostoc sp. UHCC 0252]|uniref:hypothetical protein n=1 Tax=Nostoc sp. UHCC 0252 TaxID=3110241 RepID=UPI002B1F94F2|nr:hypothetical protein [Nostoc sp. UHCC 0252]MEA5602187.1 hypothetical protein [Nostoc sp. UHCC 0252]
MVKHLFKAFLSNIDDYRASENFWRNLCESILRKHQGEKHGWKIWLNVHFNDGTPFLDGNPIYSLISPDNKKSICINQDEANKEKIYIVAWMNKFGPIDKENFIEELVIVCELSEESAQLASELIEAWIKENTSYYEMQLLIEKKL